ncbi:hypothetical protein HPC49_06340 [Pyxidicoccus fallax]|uniref:Uncharacterized protein n=1 Tax=Pyxidicoccus fallax TaxID=394095 RepID=A0A848L762_9BACT|nr:hypothetical protein [Pyxidicoccus fallax]NMO14474.1 hypothetical protein [Pyxidicoccus fallax]NPC77872.1 hypothetical protein [Pyxidicoccus fallax]
MEDIVDSIVTLFIVITVVGIPMMGLTLRFSLKPLVDAFIRLREAQLGASDNALLRERVAHLERVLEAHGLMDLRQPVSLHQDSVERLPANVPLKDRERV